MSLEMKQLFEKFGYEQAEDGSWVDKYEIIRDGLDLSADEAFADYDIKDGLRKQPKTHADDGISAHMEQFLKFAISWEKMINDEESHYGTKNNSEI